MKDLDTFQIQHVFDSVAVSMECILFLRKQVTGCCNGSTGKAKNARRWLNAKTIETCKSEDLQRSILFGLCGAGKRWILYIATRAVVIRSLFLFTKAGVSAPAFFMRLSQMALG